MQQNEISLAFELGETLRTLRYYVRLRQAGPLNVTASWTGGSSNCKLLVFHKTNLVLEKSGASPLSVTEQTSLAQVGTDELWSIHLVNLDKQPAKGTLKIQGAGIIAPQPLGAVTHRVLPNPEKQLRSLVDFELSASPRNKLTFILPTPEAGWVHAEAYTQSQGAPLLWSLASPNGSQAGEKKGVGRLGFEQEATTSGQWKLTLTNAGAASVRGQCVVGFVTKTEHNEKVQRKLDALLNRPRSPESKAMLAAFFHSMERSLSNYPGGKGKLDDAYDRVVRKNEMSQQLRSRLVGLWKSLPSTARAKLAPDGWTQFDAGEPLHMQLSKLDRRDTSPWVLRMTLGVFREDLLRPALFEGPAPSVRLVLLERKQPFRFWIFGNFPRSQVQLAGAAYRVEFRKGGQVLGGVEASNIERQTIGFSLGGRTISIPYGWQYLHGRASDDVVSQADRLIIRPPHTTDEPLPVVSLLSSSRPLVAQVRGSTGLGRARRGDTIEVTGSNFRQGAQILVFPSTLNLDNPRWNEIEAGYESPNELTFRYPNNYRTGDFVVRVENSDQIPVIDPNWTKNLTMSGMALPRITRVEPDTTRSGGDVLISAQDLPPEEDLVDMCDSGFLKVHLKKVGETDERQVSCYAHIESNRRRVGFKVPGNIKPPRAQQWEYELRLQLGRGTDTHRTAPESFTITGAPAPKAKITFLRLANHFCDDDVGWEYGCDEIEPVVTWVALSKNITRAGVLNAPNLWGHDEALINIEAWPFTEVDGPVMLLYQLIEDDPGGPSLEDMKATMRDAADFAAEAVEGNFSQAAQSGIEFLGDLVEIISAASGGGDDVGRMVYVLFDPDSVAHPDGARPSRRDRYFEGSPLQAAHDPPTGDLIGRHVTYRGVGGRWTITYTILREVPQ
jgi:hypothetical protein